MSGAAADRAGAAPASRSPRPHPARADQSDRQWRELAGAGHSQLSLGAALRARDADRPTPADIAAAEEAVVIQRRNWSPPRPG